MHLNLDILDAQDVLDYQDRKMLRDDKPYKDNDHEGDEWLV